MANFDVAIKKDELVKGGCNIPNGYVRLTEVLGSLPAYADDAAAKGTEGQVLSLDANLKPVWKNDADTTTTSFSVTSVDAAIGSVLGDKLIPTKTDTSGLTVGNPYYISNNSGETDLTAVSDITSSTAMSAAIGLAVGTTSASGILVRGLIRLNADLQPGATLYFVNNSLSATAPSTTGQYVRIAGYVLQKVSSTNSVVYFNPSQDFILLS
jgi:hypothetical protein